MRLRRFEVTLDSDTADKRWTHFQVMFENVVPMLYAENLI